MELDLQHFTKMYMMIYMTSYSIGTGTIKQYHTRGSAVILNISTAVILNISTAVILNISTAVILNISTAVILNISAAVIWS